MPGAEFGAVLRHRRREVGPLAADVLVAGGVTWLNVISHARAPWPAVTLTVVGVALLVRRRWPLVAMAAAVGYMLAGGTLVAAMVALYTVACYRGPRVWTWVSLVGIFAAVVRGELVRDGWLLAVMGAGLFTLVPVLAGLWMWQRRRLLDALRARAEQAERERHLLAEWSVAVERRRIAGEMHDVVAHRVSVIAVQAGALTTVSDDAKVSRIAEVIRTNSAAALAELRDVLGVLREDRQDAGAPAPTLDSLTALTEEFRRAGTRSTWSCPTRCPPHLPRTPERSAGWRRRLSPTRASTPGAPRCGSRSPTASTGWRSPW